MSHKIQIKTQFKELKPLLRAFELLGWTIEKGVVAVGWGGGEVHELVAKNTVLRNDRELHYYAQDLVIEKNESKRIYEVHNNMDSDVAQIALQSLGGVEMNALRRKYGIEVIKNKAAETGSEVEINEGKNGNIEVLVTSHY